MENHPPNIAERKDRLVATPDGPQHPFWRSWTEEGAQPQEADSSLIGRLLGSAPPTDEKPPAPVQEDPGSSLIGRLLASTPPTEAIPQAPLQEAPEIVDLSEVVVPEAVEHGDPVVHFIRVARPRSAPHLVSLPVDHRKTQRVIRLHEPHLDRPLTESDKFAHWRRWMVASKRKELAR